jgi:hypothetical protein
MAGHNHLRGQAGRKCLKSANSKRIVARRPYSSREGLPSRAVTGPTRWITGSLQSPHFWPQSQQARSCRGFYCPRRLVAPPPQVKKKTIRPPPTFFAGSKGDSAPSYDTMSCYTGRPAQVSVPISSLFIADGLLRSLTAGFRIWFNF